MPTYEYVCDKCSHSFERFQGIKDKPLKKCPECGSKIRRVISTGAGIIFKGNGFYQTDYKGGGAKGGPSSCGKAGGCPSCDHNA